MERQLRILIVENEREDLKRAAEAAQSVGFTEIEAKVSPQAARIYLEAGLEGRVPVPDGILLDLDFGYESGYELLRFWHSHEKVRAIPLVVWSILGEEQREMCNLFKVNRFIGKWEDNSEFLAALKSMVPAP